VGGVKKLADNFLVSSLSELVGRQRPSKYPFCDICKLLSGKHRDATSKCLDCAKLLCAACVQMHKQTKVDRGEVVNRGGASVLGGVTATGIDLGISDFVEQSYVQINVNPVREDKTVR